MAKNEIIHAEVSRLKAQRNTAINRLHNTTTPIGRAVAERELGRIEGLIAIFQLADNSDREGGE